MRVVTLVWCVCVCVSVGGTTDIHQEGRHFIYPRTGRLFHSDYVRDNRIFQSLERTNFMRRGPLAARISSIRTSRGTPDDDSRKKHVYTDSGRIATIETKKDFLERDKDVPSKAVLLKVSHSSPGETQIERRIRRDVTASNDNVRIDDSKQDPLKSNHAESTDIYLGNINLEAQPLKISNEQTETHKEEDLKIKTENKVEEDNNPHVKNNDTDKTLFVHDSKPEEQMPKAIKLQEEEQGKIVAMKKTVVDDGLKLYPVYNGVSYRTPVTERRLLYSPKLMVQMNLPVISETISRSENNATEDAEVEGRSRRPLKKLAFPLLLALKLKTAIMLPLILGLIGLISFKGLWSGLTALVIAAALGLKALVAGSTRVLVQGPHLPPPPPHYHHFPPHEITEYWSRRGEEYNDYRPNSWST